MEYIFSGIFSGIFTKKPGKTNRNLETQLWSEKVVVDYLEKVAVDVITKYYWRIYKPISACAKIVQECFSK